MTATTTSISDRLSIMDQLADEINAIRFEDGNDSAKAFLAITMAHLIGELIDAANPTLFSEEEVEFVQECHDLVGTITEEISFNEQ